MLRSTFRCVAAICLVAFASSCAFCDVVDSVLGYKAILETDWVYLNAKETREAGLQKGLADEIRKMGTRSDDEIVSREIDKASAKDFELILLDTAKGDLRDNINVRQGQGTIPINQAQATLLKVPVQGMLQKLLGGPVRVHSTELVQLAESADWALLMDYDLTLAGTTQHQVQYIIASDPGAATKLIVTGTFFTENAVAHRALMSEFMKNFELKSID